MGTVPDAGKEGQSHTSEERHSQNPCGGTAAADENYERDTSEEQTTILSERSQSGSLKEPFHLSTDVDVIYARKHPLGKVLLKQIQELRGIQECDTPEVKVIVEGLMRQIRNMRESSESGRGVQKEVSMEVQESGPVHITKEDIQTLPECEENVLVSHHNSRVSELTKEFPLIPYCRPPNGIGVLMCFEFQPHT